MTRHPFAVRRLAVTAVERLTPGMVRVTFAGPELEGFTSTGPSDHVKIFFPGADGVLHAPRLEDGRPVRDEGVEYVSRDYTPRWADADGLQIDFVLHGDDGPASAWAARAAVGQELAIAGPRGSRSAPTGADWWFLMADVTALPAMSRWIEAAPEGVPVRAIVFADEAEADYPLPQASVEWVIGGMTPEQYLREEEHLPPGTGFVWAAGEAGSLIPVRRYLRRDLALPADQVKVEGYWRSGVADADHHAPLDPAEPEEG